jgi:putative thioredoxin
MKDASSSDWVIDVTDTDFETEVLERSNTTPVIVDFWAPWCGPCRQLGPLLEQAAKDKNGAFVLAKVNVDEAQQLAGYFRIESIPAVLAFREGQAVNGFVGLMAPEDLQQFIDDLAPAAGEELPLKKAANFETTDPTAAEALYRQLIEEEPTNIQAVLGLARTLVARNADDEATQILANIGDSGDVGAEAVRLRRTIEMRRNAGTAGDTADLNKKVAADPENAQLRYELGNVLATNGQYREALESLLKAAELDIDLGRTTVRELMVKIFEIIGVRSELADEFRDKLTALLY